MGLREGVGMTVETNGNRLAARESCCPDLSRELCLPGSASGWAFLLILVLGVLLTAAALPGLAQAAPFDEQEYFDTNNTVNDWSYWRPTDANGNSNGNPGSNGWLMTRNTATNTNGSTLTPSQNTGPTSVHSGGGSGGFLFLENSGSPPYPDRYFTRNASFDASSNELNISFAYSMYGAGMGTLQLQANDGSGWTTEWQQIGDDGFSGAWSTVTINLYNGEGLSAKNYTSGSVGLRFRFVSGSTWQADAAIDTIRVFGNDSCIETASVSLDPIASPISASVAITASLGGIGGGSVQVSFDGSSWLPNGSNYTPPASSSGTNNFYARAIGSCGFTIYDPYNPTPVAYDTTCVDPSPSTINIPIGQVVNGSAVNLSSLIVPTGNVGNFSYKINGAAVGTPWNSNSYGTSSPEVISFEVTGTDPDCGGKQLIGHGYITVDNTCVTAAPSFGLDSAEKYSAADSSVDFTITVYNNDSGACSPDTFTITAAGDTHPNFIGSITGSTPLVIGPGASASTTLNVAVTAGTPDWELNDTTIQVVVAAHTDPADQTARTIAYRLNPMMHNSITTASNKHGGKWGTSQTGAKYGEFNCNTCHQMGSGNIKGIRGALGSAANPVPVDFPGAGAPISFLDVRDGSSDFGDDSRADKMQSDNICEVCHTYDGAKAAGVDKHAFDMSVPGDIGHFNRQDCTACHRHSDGFKASCTVCHGDQAGGNFWPDSSPVNAYPERLGSHVKHVEKIGNYIASGDKNNSSFTTMAHKNTSCAYCHPNPGNLNPDGAAHNVDTIGSPANTVDVAGDGFNSGYFLYLDGSNDVDGIYNPALQRCSNIDCHSNGQFTWSWYGDSLAPATVTDLGAGTGSEIGTVDLTWTAPGNDSNTAGKAYRYEVRYRATPITDEASWSSATVAGAPPTAKWPGFAQAMTVYGLTPGATYYFAIKSADEAGNWSALSSPNPSAIAKTDAIAPIFHGLETAAPAYTSGAINLSWAAASDTSKPIEYLLWWKDTGQTIDYGLAPDAVTSGLSYQVAGLSDGTNYKFAVRARDAAGNVDLNTEQKEAIPQMPAEKDWLGTTYYAGLLSGGTCDTKTTYTGSLMTGTMTTSGYSCLSDDKNEISQVTSAVDVFRWVAPNPYAETMNITGGTFRIYIQEKDDVDQNVTIRLGYMTSGTGGSFVELGNSTKTIKRRMRGMVNFSLLSIEGQIPAGKHLAMVFSKADQPGKELKIRYASDRYRSELTVYQQVANARPNAFTVATPAPGTPAAVFDISWTNAVDPDGDPVTYDVYGVLADGTSYVIAEDVSGNDASWDSKADGVGATAAASGVVIKVRASDGLSHKEGVLWYDHREAVSGSFTINNTSDITAPAPVTDLVAEARPKTGSVYLYWSAPGDDALVGRAAQYDIRYSTSQINSANFAAASQVPDEPVPGEPGHRQGYEVLGLTEGQSYYFALKTADEVPNWSGLSNVPLAKGGPSCGVCHSTPPDQADRAGMHEQHGYTQIDCSKCHGSEAVNYTNNHADGVNKLAFNNPKKGYGNTAYGAVTATATRVTYHSGGTGAGVVLYDDTTGGGGFNDIEPGGDNLDNGSCFGFNATGVSGCHGAAGSDPDGGGPLPTYPSPKWGDITSVSCAMCHGDQSRADATPYNRPFEDGSRDTRYAGNIQIFKAAPGIDLQGNSDSNAVGQHLRHLNFSYRFTGHSCALCHQGNEHADGTVDVILDKSVAGASAAWVPEAAGAGTPGTCIGTTDIRCHGNNSTDPQWKTRSPEPNGPRIVECNECHGFTGMTYDIAGNSSTITHVKDGGLVRHCTWCHVEGHPREGYSVSAITKANPAQVTSANHGLTSGDTVVLQIDGMDELDERFATVTVIDANNFTLDGINSSSYGTFTSGYWKRSYAATGISAITKANPAQVTSTGHGLSTGDNVLLQVQGMIQLDTYDGPVTVIDANNFTLDGVNSSGYGTFTSGSWVRHDGAILLPNYSIAGIDYSSGGIHLRRVVNGRTNLNNGDLIDTEAETCWGCHEDNGISEWGTNTKSLTGNSPYNYGSLNKTSWIGAIWSSANFSYKDGAIQSTHSVNPDVLAPGADSAADLRCSYCHDVHNLNKANGDKATGAPYLRGSWKGNPYKEDGAPGRNDRGSQVFTGTSYYAEIDFGRVPRGTPAQQKMGGYWIDQNSGYPTASWSLANSAGLCTMCHGIDVNNMNKFGNPADAWVGTNGHSNAVIGGSSSNKYNVYSPSLRGEGTTFQIPGMAYQDTTGGSSTRMYGLRNQRNGDGVAPYAWNDDTAKYEYAYEEFNWGLDRDTVAADLAYHRFSCSKCHNPHASRLPKLMITNCLDISHNTWDNLYTGDSKWSTWKDRGALPYNGTDPTGAPVDQQVTYATSAQNCHRYIDVNGDGIPNEAGWNKLTPWRE